jgi:outer membrane receptor for ferrienterochelin and colicin
VKTSRQRGILALFAGVCCWPPDVVFADAEAGIVATAPVKNEENQIAAGVWTSEDGAKVTYEASFFEPYQIVNAADMLRWVPGGAELLPEQSPRQREENEKRGFGSAGDQILINGKRISGKSNDVQSAMQRIQASVVDRIELIRGTTSGLDVRSEGTIINVVLSDEISGGAGSWRLHSGFYGGSPEYDGLVSYSNSIGRLSYLTSVEYGPYNRGSDIERIEEFFTPDTRTLYQHRDIAVPELVSELVFNASGSWSFENGDVLNINGRVADHEKEEPETTIVTFVGVPDTQTLFNSTTEDGLDWEIGGDHEKLLGTDGLLKSRFIYSNKAQDTLELVSLASAIPGNVPAESRVDTDELQTETIVRSSYTWPLRNSQNLELGVEAAINTLDKDVALFEVLPDGTLDPIDVFNANSEIKENRYEFFSTHFWQMRDNLVLESALNIEYSKIAQSGTDVDNSRSFTYLKPRFDLRLDLSTSTQLRSSLERTVSQLDFADFVASFDNDDNQVDAGNPDLEPEKAWETKITLEQRLAEDNGSLEAQLFYNDIEDHIDKVAATEFISAAGNIGDARNYGVTLKGSLRLAALNLDGAVIDASYTWQDSETTDPFTGETRVMIDKPANRYSLTFRHDISAWKLSYTIDTQWNDVRYATDINFRERNESVNGRTNFSIQYQLTNTLILWFDSRIVFDSHSRRERERYIGNIADDNLLRYEVRDQWFRREVIVGLRGQF